MSKTPPVLTAQLIDWMYVIRGEFDEVPGLQLTLDDATDRWALDADSLATILETFVDVGLLERSADGRYERPRPLEAEPPDRLPRRAV